MTRATCGFDHLSFNTVGPCSSTFKFYQFGVVLSLLMFLCIFHAVY